MIARARRDSLVVFAVALSARLGMVLWAAERIPPTADGAFYDTIARRIAAGLGYTWLWPDGAVTYAAHYPVGYPAIMGGVYAVFGAHPGAVMVLQALMGSLVAVAVHALALRAANERRALIVGLLAAAHVAWVAYTPALMTEGTAAALLIAAAVAVTRAGESSAGRRVAWWCLLGLLLGGAALVRPQSLLLAPWFAWFAVGPAERVARRFAAVAVVLVSAALVFGPWIVRNQVRMSDAGLSFNGGWNLLIGATPSANGTFAPLAVPGACKAVFDEAAKDTCFRDAAVRQILADPWAWILLIPKKLAVTFDYCGAAGWYLHDANPSAFSYRAKVVLGVLETLQVRALWLAALVSAAWIEGPRRRARGVVAGLSALALLTMHAWPAVVGLVVVIALLGRRLARMPVVVPLAMGVVLATAASHAVFLGAGRYAMVVFPFITALAAGVVDTSSKTTSRASDSIGL
jgi:4-amino-4-deoxy-L-arabinose transferase-like glycosyltransferase